MALPLKFTFFIAADQTLLWGPVVTGATANLPNPTYVNDASGTATLRDPFGVPVAGFTNLAMTYVPASNGMYTASILGAGFNPSPGTSFSLFVSLTSPTQGTDPWTIPAVVKVRSSSDVCC